MEDRETPRIHKYGEFTNMGKLKRLELWW